MRIRPEIRSFIKEKAQWLFPDTEVYLFGSRVNDELTGGDIDILLLSREHIDMKQIRLFRREIFKKFGWQKLDLVNFTFNEESTFKQLIIKDAQLL